MRHFTDITNNEEVKRLLDVLVDQGSEPSAYKTAMKGLGSQLASSIVGKMPAIKQSLVCVACTVEDADFLARGLLEGLRAEGIEDSHLKLACFWNERVRRFNDEDSDSFDVAPIIKQYKEDIALEQAVVIVVKSIVSGACVVKTNIANLIDNVLPSRVIVAAPVMHEGAQDRLASEFPRSVADRFEYFTFAIDDEKQGESVVPGIGGMVYDRLGFQNDKNSYIPDLVKERRSRAAA